MWYLTQLRKAKSPHFWNTQFIMTVTDLVGPGLGVYSMLNLQFI